MSKKSSPCAAQLYQLCSSRQLPNGAYVEVNGPHDRYGVVQSSTPIEDGKFLNMIRGCPYKPGETVQARF